MKRSALHRRTPLRRGGPIATRKTIRAVNRERIARLRAVQFGGPYADFVRSLPCCTCGAPPPSIAHHSKSRGAGGTARDMVALCPAHHGTVHTIGRETFARVFGVDLEAVARNLWENRSRGAQA